MLGKTIKSLLIVIYAVLVVSYCFFADKTLNILLSSKMFFAHFYAFPVLFALVISVVAVLIFIIGVIRDKKGYFTRLKFFFPLLIVFLSVILAFCSSNVKERSGEVDHGTSTSMKIVELNAQNTLEPAAVTKIFKEFDADIAVFPEFGGYVKGDDPKHRMSDLMESEGISSRLYHFYSSAETEGNIAPVTIVVKKAFNDYKAMDNKPMTRFGTVYLQSTQQNCADIIGLHTAPPLPGLMDRWNSDLNLIGKEIMPENKNAIVLGDFNATTRHGALNLIDSHEDALDFLPRFKRGTWGLSLAESFRTSIDHVYIPKGKYLVERVELCQFNGPDHMGIFLELAEK